MKRSTKPTENRAKKPGRPVKQPLLEAFSDLEYELQIMTGAFRILNLTCALPEDDPLRKIPERIEQLSDALEQVHLANAAFKKLLYEKRPGGAHPHRYRGTAFNLLTDHYINTSTVMRAPDLVAAVIATLPKETPLSDADGKEVFPIRIARDVRKCFVSIINSSNDE